MDKPVELTFRQYWGKIAMKIPHLIINSYKNLFAIINLILLLITALNKQIGDILKLYWIEISPWWSLLFIGFLLLWLLMNAIYEDRKELYLAYNDVERNAKKDKEQYLSEMDKLKKQISNNKSESIPSIEILSHTNGRKVKYQEPVQGRISIPNSPVQVLVYSGDDYWHPQRDAIVSGNYWEAECQFGDENSSLPASYKIVAISTTQKIQNKLAKLPSVPQSEEIAVVRIKEIPSIAKKAASHSRIFVSILGLAPNQPGYLDMRVTFTNDSIKSVVIDLAYLVTADINTILKINKQDIVIKENYINSLTKFEPIDKSFPQKPNLPKTLTAGEVWVTNIKESFSLASYLKDHQLQGVRRIPVGIMIRLINYKGIMFFPSKPNKTGVEEPVPYFT
jgi:hypothetical protein